MSVWSLNFPKQDPSCGFMGFIGKWGMNECEGLLFYFILVYVTTLKWIFRFLKCFDLSEDGFPFWVTINFEMHDQLYAMYFHSFSFSSIFLLLIYFEKDIKNNLVTNLRMNNMSCHYWSMFANFRKAE